MEIFVATKAIALTIATITFAGCIRDKEKKMDEIPPKIYVVGFETCGETMWSAPPAPTKYTGFIATMWSGGESKRLADKDVHTEAEHIFASNGDVYITGSMNSHKSRAMMWKNGEILPLEGNYEVRIKSLYVSGKDVYVTGNYFEGSAGDVFFGNEKRIGILWRNGERTTFGNESEANGIHVLGKTVIVAGEKRRKAAIWINGKITILDKNWSQANAVWITEKKIYVVGTGGDYDNKPVIWVNGKKSILPLEKTKGEIIGEAQTVTVFGNDVYVTGKVLIENVGHELALWKNGIRQNISFPNLPNSIIQAIFIKNGEPYILRRVWEKENDVEMIYVTKGDKAYKIADVKNGAGLHALFVE